MTQAVFIKKARHDIWDHGKPVKKTHDHGKNAGIEYTGYDHSVPGSKTDILLVAKGQSYWKWQFAFGPIHYSLTQPRQSQLTQSAHLSAIYSLTEALEDLTVDDDLESSVEEIKGQAEEERDTCEEARSNMPEQLQDSGSGETLQNYVDALEDFIQELEGVDTDVEEPDDDELAQEWADLSEDDRGQAPYEEWKKDRAAELEEERKQEILDELQAIRINV